MKTNIILFLLFAYVTCEAQLRVSDLEKPLSFYNQLDSSGKRQGIWYEMTKDSIISERLIYADDVLHGECLSYWTTTGHISSRINYVNGVKEGKITVYYDSGKVAYIGTKKNGLSHGEFQGFDQNGERTHIKIYENGEETWVRTYRNGVESSETYYENGGMIIDNLYYQDGVLKRKDMHISTTIIEKRDGEIRRVSMNISISPLSSGNYVIYSERDGKRIGTYRNAERKVYQETIFHRESHNEEEVFHYTAEKQLYKKDVYKLKKKFSIRYYIVKNYLAQTHYYDEAGKVFKTVHYNTKGRVIKTENF